MKFEIDLNDILGDDGEQETLQESVRRQVIANITATIQKGVLAEINEETARILNEELGKVLKEQMPALLADIFNTEYRPVDRYGSRSEATTFRRELVKKISEEMVYKKTSFDSDKNAFTEAVDSAVGEKMKEFREAWVRQVDTAFLGQAMQYAADAFLKRAGVKA